MNHPVESSNKNPESLGISYLYTYSSNIYSQAGFLGVCLILVTFLPPLGIYPWEGRLPLLGYYIHDKEITEGERAVCARGKEGERVTDPPTRAERGKGYERA